MRANFRESPGEAKHGTAIQLTRTLYRWLMRRLRSFYFFYIRRGAHISPDSLSRATESRRIDYNYQNKMRNFSIVAIADIYNELQSRPF